MLSTPDKDAIREGEPAAALHPVSKDALVGRLHVFGLAVIYALVGEADAALDQIEYLLANPSWLSVALLRLDPTWDPLRGNPRFQAMLEEYPSVGT